MYAKLTIHNNSPIKRFSHARRFEVALDTLSVDTGSAVLDYGTGDGYFLIALCSRNSGVKAFGYEPVPEMFEELLASLQDSKHAGNISVYQCLDDLLEMRFEAITCFEVLEHLDGARQRAALRNMKTMLRKDGVLLVSVPIEVGPSSLAKNLLRLILRQEHEETSFLRLVKAFLGVPMQRAALPYIPSHLGFDFRKLEKLFSEEGLVVNLRRYSPFQYFGTVFNSQVLYLLSVGKKAE